MNITAQDFLNSTELSIAEGIVLEEFDPDDLKDFTGLMEGNIGFTQSEALNGLFQSSKTSDKTDNPSTPSYQPLNEAGVLTSGEAINKSAIGSVTNNSIGIQEDAQSSLENTAKFVPSEIDFNPTEETLKKMREAQDTLAKGVKSLANGAELANSGIKFAGGNLQFAGNSIQLGSDGMVHMTSPIINTVADVENKQATTIQETTNQKTTVAKSTFTQIEELESTVSGNKMTTVTNSDVSVSNYKSTTALEKHLTNSQTIENTAGDLIKNRSLNGVTTEADGVISSTSPSISIVAAEGAKSQAGQKDVIGSSGGTGLTSNDDGSFDVTATNTSGETVRFSGLKTSQEEKWKSVGGLQGQDKANITPSKSKKGKGDLSILADGSGGTVSIINKNTVVSSTSHFNASVGGNLSQVAKGNVTSSGRFVNAEADAGLTLNGSGYIRQQSGRTGTFISNGFTFAGFRFPNLNKFIDKAKNIPLEIREIPALSDLPLAIGVSDLANCLPKKYTEPDQPSISTNDSVVDIPDEIAAPTAADARQRNKGSAIPVGKDATSAGEGGLLDQVQGVGSTKIDGVTILAKDSSPTDQTVLPRNKITSASSVFKGGSDVYPAESQEAFDLYKRQGALIIDPDADEEVGGPELIVTLIQSINSHSLTNVSIKLNQPPEHATALKDNINAIKNYLYTEFQISESLLDTSQLLTPEQGAFIDTALAIPEQKEIINSLITAVETRASVGGFLSFLSEAYEKVSDSVSIASDLIEDNSNRNVFQVLEGASDIAATLTNDEVFTDLYSIISSSESLSNIYGQVNSIVKDGNVTVSEIIDNISFQDIENVISSGLNTIGVDNLQTASSIARILRDVKNSTDYKENGLTREVSERIIFDIINETGLDAQQARDIYEDSQTVIAQVLSGDVESIIEGSELQNVLGFFIGSSNAALLSDLRNVYTRGATVLNQGRDIFNTGQDLFQSGVDFYNTIQSVPALVGMMNAYEIPLLNQVKIVLQCLELVEQVKRIIENVKRAGNSFNQFGESIENTFQAFEDLLGINSNRNVSALEAASEGFARGNLTSQSENTFTDSVNETLPLLNSNLGNEISEEGLEDINSINNSKENTTDTNNDNPFDQTIINGTELTAENCSTIIYSYSADTNDSTNAGNWSESVSTEEAINIIEALPRLTQIYNSIKEAPAEVSVNGSKTIFGTLTPEQLNSIQNSEINTETDACYIAPNLNLLESTVKVLQIKDGVMLYKMSYPQSLKFNNKNIFPTNNTIVQIYVEEFFNNKTRETMRVFRTNEFFSPKIYSFKTTVFDRDKNLGIAYLMNSQTRIHLKNASSTPYNYSITDIGKKLDPIIVDSYIVA